MGLTTRLGDAATRRRRHRKFALLGIVLLVVAGVLIIVGQDDGDDSQLPDVGDTETPVAADAAGTCEAFSERVRTEYQLSFPEGGPLNDEAAAEYLSRAFADTMDDLVTALRDQELSAEVAAIVDELDARVDDVRANPGNYLHASPLGDLAGRFDAADLAACGSEFFGPSE